MKHSTSCWEPQWVERVSLAVSVITTWWGFEWGFAPSATEALKLWFPIKLSVFTTSLSRTVRLNGRGYISFHPLINVGCGITKTIVLKASKESYRAKYFLCLVLCLLRSDRRTRDTDGEICAFVIPLPLQSAWLGFRSGHPHDSAY